MDPSSSELEDETSQGCENSDAKSGLDLPAKSRERYLKCYESFIEWRASEGYRSFSEAVVLAYFKELAKTKRKSTLWCIYSMLRATIVATNNVNLNTYRRLRSFIKSQAKGYLTKKSKVFSAEDIEKFMKDAPDDFYLSTKVVLIFGICGACRVTELISIRPEDVQKHSDQLMLVNTIDTPTNIKRSFVIQDEYVQIVEKYQALRPPNMDLNRFFIKYSNGKCSKQGMGKNNFNQLPRRIASFLNLPNPELYTGHCLRKSSRILLAKSAGNVMMRKQSGGWQTSEVEDYLTRSTNKRLLPSWRPARPKVPQIESQDKTELDFLLDGTQHCEFLLDETDGLIKIKRSESPLDGTQEIDTNWSESRGDESHSVKSNDPFDLGPEECEPSPPLARAARRPLYLSVRQLAALERRRLRLDEVRARQLHARETERLRVEARRLEVDAERTRALARIADVAMAWLERLKGNGYMAPRY